MTLHSFLFRCLPKAALLLGRLKSVSLCSTSKLALRRYVMSQGQIAKLQIIGAFRIVALALSFELISVFGSKGVYFERPSLC